VDVKAHSIQQERATDRIGNPQGKAGEVVKYTYTDNQHWTSQHKLTAIPKSQVGQIELLERAVYELYDWLMDELGYDNPHGISDRLSDQVNLIAHRAYERGWDK